MVKMDVSVYYRKLVNIPIAFNILFNQSIFFFFFFEGERNASCTVKGTPCPLVCGTLLLTQP